MQTFELGKFIDSIVHKHEEHASTKGISLLVSDDLAARILLSGNRTKMERLMNTVLESTIENGGAHTISLSIRQLVRSASEILLEFALEDDSRTPRCIAYYRAMVQARHLIEEMNGKSQLLSTHGRNTILKFIIQCRWKSISDTASTDFRNLVGKQVLVVEDNELNQGTISQILRSRGMACTIAENGREAIDILERHHHFDIVLLDMNMPRMNGAETAKYIRKKLKMTLPIIGMSAGPETATIKDHTPMDINRVIFKPFTADELAREMSRLFEPAGLELPLAHPA